MVKMVSHWSTYVVGRHSMHTSRIQHIPHSTPYSVYMNQMSQHQQVSLISYLIFVSILIRNTKKKYIVNTE